MTTYDYAKAHTCLSTITGSKAYGLDHADSDTDRMSIFVAPSADVAGLFWDQHEDSWTNTSPDGDDETFHEIRKFIRLALRGNPTLIELLFMDSYEYLDEVGQGLLAVREDITSTSTIRSSYSGYAFSQYNRVKDAGPGKFKPKMARHTLRIARQGLELLETGTMSVRVPDPQEYWDLTEKPFEEMLRIIEKPLNKIDCCTSVLPSKPNLEPVAEFLGTVRRTHVN